MSPHATHARLHALWCACLLSVLSVALYPHASAGTVHPVLRSMIEEGPSDRIVPVWVFFSDRGFSDEEERQAALRAAAQRISDAALARRAGVGVASPDEYDLPVATAYREEIARVGRIRHASHWLNGVSAWVALREITRIASLPFVTEVRPVARGRPSGLGPRNGPDGRLLERPDPAKSVRIFPDPGRDDIYGPSFDQLDEIGVIEAHAAGFTGARVSLMMLDTGFRKDHDAFAQTSLLAERDYVFGDGNTQNEPEDDPGAHWHGTATWGACGGYAPGALVGPAFGATFLLAKTEDIRSEMPIEEDNYVAALEWGDSLGVMVTSASLIYRSFDDGNGWTYEQLDGDTAPITRAIDRAAGRGILCVNAIGNYGPEPGSLGEPADADSMLSCGAVNSEGEIAGFSSRGPRVDGMLKPEVVARGVDTWCADANDPSGYLGASGTSLSTPLVGGACALVMEAHPEWSAYQVREALMATAQRWGPPDNAYGYGRVHVWAAIGSAPLIVPAPFSLIRPADGETVADLSPTFVWESSTDPQGRAIRYEIWIDDDPGFGSPAIYSDLPDTVFTVPDPLAPQTAFSWRVIAEEQDGYRRLCRADRAFDTPPPSGFGDLPIVSRGWRLDAAPNPWQQGSVLRWYAPPGTLHETVRLTILDPIGRRLLRERIEVTSIGWNEWRWEPRTLNGAELPSGIYLALLETTGETARTKVVLTR